MFMYIWIVDPKLVRIYGLQKKIENQTDFNPEALKFPFSYEDYRKYTNWAPVEVRRNQNTVSNYSKYDWIAESWGMSKKGTLNWIVQIITRLNRIVSS